MVEDIKLWQLLLLVLVRRQGAYCLGVKMLDGATFLSGLIEHTERKFILQDQGLLLILISHDMYHEKLRILNYKIR